MSSLNPLRYPKDSLNTISWSKESELRKDIPNETKEGQMLYVVVKIMKFL